MSSEGFLPPDKCATRLRYTPTRANPYRTWPFEARGDFMAKENETKIAHPEAGSDAETPTELPRDVAESFPDADEVLTAIRRVQKHLRDGYIVDSCRGHPVVGCASCEAVDLERLLEKFAGELV
jgi:hypothetical protein